MLTPEEMEQIPDMELPEVPKELLHNFLTQSRAIRKEGVLGWEVKQQRNGTSRTCFLPLLKSRQIGSVTFWYQVNPTIGTYEMRTEPEELTMETEPIGSYGLAWMHWMEENYPEKVEEMRFYHRFLTVARSVDKRAWEYRNRLDSQYLSGTLIRMASRNYALSSAAQTENPSAAQTDGAGKQKYASIPLPKIKKRRNCPRT